MRYEEELRALSGYTHGRNARLVRLAMLGLSAGRGETELAAEIIKAGGEPRLTAAEVTRAIAKARQNVGDRPRAIGDRPRFDARKCRNAAVNADLSPNKLEQGFVKRLIAAGRGGTSRTLRELSRPFGDRPFAAFLRTIFAAEDELVLVGNPFLPRTRENLHSVGELCESRTAAVSALLRTATHIIPNPFTGQPGLNSQGNESYCLDSTVAHRRMALVEFDELPLKEQCEFWCGAIREKLLPVRTLVYSGAKSIHGLIELVDDGTAAKWQEQWLFLERILCSDPDRAYHADRACRNPARFTRMPGAVRPESGCRQTLLYLG